MRIIKCLILVSLLSFQGCTFLKDFHNGIVNADSGLMMRNLPETGNIYTPSGSYNYVVFSDGNIYVGD